MTLPTPAAALLCLIAAFAISAGSAAAQYPDYNTSPADGDKSGMEMSATEIADAITLGWNLGNSLEAVGGETAWGNPKTSKALIDLVAASGFDAIRLPVAWDLHANSATAEIDKVWMDRVEQVVGYALDNDLFVVLNIHWDGGWLEEHVTPADEARVTPRQRAFWQQIATRFRDYDQRLLFAGANEPNVDTPAQMAVLDTYHQAFVDAVRETGGRNAYRTLIVQGPRTDIEKTLAMWNGLPEDIVEDRLMVEVHFYTPYQFTLMTGDADWGDMFYYWGDGLHSDKDRKRNATWGEEATVEEQFTAMKHRFSDQGVPVILGEYSAMRRTGLKGDALEQAHASRYWWHAYVTRAAIRAGLVPFYWDAGGLGNHSSGIFDRHRVRVFDEATLDALTTGAGL